jgi:hypothetical protein
MAGPGIVDLILRNTEHYTGELPSPHKKPMVIPHSANNVLYRITEWLDSVRRRYHEVLAATNGFLTITPDGPSINPPK